VVVTCEVFYPLPGMLIPCRVTSITKAGITGEWVQREGPSPVVVFVSRDHFHQNPAFQRVTPEGTFSARVVSQRFELGFVQIEVMGEIVEA
jgi:hypothetical protein